MSDWSVEFLNARVVPIGLMLIMFSLGLTLMLRDFALVARNPKLVGAGFFTHLLLLPLLGLSIALLRMNVRKPCPPSSDERSTAR